VTIDFDTYTTSQGAYYGKSNVADDATTPIDVVIDGETYIANSPIGCDASPCHHEEGVIVGTPLDVSQLGSHLHLASSAIAYHADAAGIYIRTEDYSAFSADSFFMDAAISASNTEVDGFWEIKGFNEALTSPTQAQVAYQTVSNGYSGQLQLSDAFNNIKSLWLHYGDTPHVPWGTNGDHLSFSMTMDTIELSSAVTTVPIPTAAYLLGTGLIGLISFNRRKAARLST